MKKNIFNLILLLTILCGFNSCVDKPLDPIDNPEDVLCNGSGWIDSYTDVDGFFCEQRLVFFYDGRGEETIIRHFSNFPGDFEELRSSFRWDWDDDNYSSIYMEYGNGDYIIFDDLSIHYDRLSGYFGDDYVTFRPF